jgi:hypothetical protein
MIDEIGRVAHYSSLKNLANILHDKRIKLGNVASLADPRESSLSWIETIGIGHESCPDDLFRASKLKNSVGERLRIFCTASVKDALQRGGCPIESSIYGRPRMWSQYGENSKGFCVVLNHNELNQRMSDLVENPNHLLSGRVSYFDWVHSVQGSIEIEYGNGVKSPKKNLFGIINQNEMLRSIYFKKSIDWVNEEEFRWLLFSESKEPIYVSIENAVEAVVLGCEFPWNQRSQAKHYCEDLGCSGYRLEYQHPRYKLHQVF